MNADQLHHLCYGIVVGLKKSKELFRSSMDTRGACMMLSKGNKCQCFLCLCDNEIATAERTLEESEQR